MPTKPATSGEVKSICNSLEVSPSSHSPGSSIYNAGTEPHAAKHKPKHTAHGADSGIKEAGFGVSRRTAAKNVSKNV